MNRVYNSVAEKISKEQLKSATDIIRALRLIYPADERFRAAFLEKQIRTTLARNRQVMRYILFVYILNATSRIRRLIMPAINAPSSIYCREHPDENWASFTHGAGRSLCLPTPSPSGLPRTAEIGKINPTSSDWFLNRSCFKITQKSGQRAPRMVPGVRVCLCARMASIRPRLSGQFQRFLEKEGDADNERKNASRGDQPSPVQADLCSTKPRMGR